VSFNSLRSYAESLNAALTKPYPPYEAIGLRDGESYRQLGTTLLQIENEFYSTIRPKRVVESGERPLRALRERGVQYIEVRAMDLDPFSAIGITLQTVRFLDIFLLHCLLSNSPPDTPDEIALIGRNKQRVAARGRKPGLLLERDDGKIELRRWSNDLLAQCAPIAAAMDAAHGSTDYAAALSVAVRGVADPESLPSARMLAAMRQQHGGSYCRFVLEQSLRHRNALLGEPLPADVESRFRRMADESLERQRRIEADDDLPFEMYRQQYLSPESLRPE
jgi:glutamate--cysteine ligase